MGERENSPLQTLDPDILAADKLLTAAYSPEKVDSKDGTQPKVNKVGNFQCFNLYVGNLPTDWSRTKIREIFRRFREVIQVFVSRKLNKKGKRFGFVRMGLEVDICKVIGSLHGSRFGNNRAIVRQAESFDFRTKTPARDLDCPKLNYVPASAFQHLDKRSFKEVAQGVLGESETLLRVKPTGENDEWLGRSLIGWLSLPCSPSIAAAKLKELIDLEVEVRFMGGNMLLLSCKTILDVNFLLNNRNLLSLLFVKIEMWDHVEVGNVRLAWIRCSGVPLHIWGPEVFKKIGAVWGEFVCLDRATKDKMSLDYGRVLVSTGISGNIAGVVRIAVGSKNFKISVLEEAFEGVYGVYGGIKIPELESLNGELTTVKENVMAVFPVNEEASSNFRDEYDADCPTPRQFYGPFVSAQETSKSVARKTPAPYELVINDLDPIAQECAIRSNPFSEDSMELMIRSFDPMLLVENHGDNGTVIVDCNVRKPAVLGHDVLESAQDSLSAPVHLPLMEGNSVQVVAGSSTSGDATVGCIGEKYSVGGQAEEDTVLKIPSAPLSLPLVVDQSTHVGRSLRPRKKKQLSVILKNLDNEKSIKRKKANSNTAASDNFRFQDVSFSNHVVEDSITTSDIVNRNNLLKELITVPPVSEAEETCKVGFSLRKPVRWVPPL